jgi:uncharacterized membrane protein YgcG
MSGFDQRGFDSPDFADTDMRQDFGRDDFGGIEPDMTASQEPVSRAPILSNRITNAASGAGASISTGARNAYNYATGRGLTTLVIILVAVGVFAALAYTVYQILSTNLKVVTLLNKPLNALSQSTTVKSEKFPNMSNGKEFSVSFWVYVESQSNTSNLRQVISIGDKSDELSPLVMMDRTTNKMFIAMRTMSSPSMTTSAIIESYSASLKARTTSNPHLEYNKSIIMEIEYVPLGRWLNVVAVLDNDVVSLFVDGDMYSVAPISRFADRIQNTSPGGGAGGGTGGSGGSTGGNSGGTGGNSGGTGGTGRPDPASALVAKDPAGGLNVGGINGISGYVANVQVANYAFSIFHARAIYRAGPVRRTLSWLLPSNIKLQWPITTVETD